MPQPIVMPSMGMYTEEGVLSTWLKPSGARVQIEDPVLEITTEKVTFEVPAPAAGILHHVAQVGTTLRVQELIGYILAEGESLPSAAEPTSRDLASNVSPPGHEAPAAAPKAAGPLRASPAARRLAIQHGIDLSRVKASGPGGRIVEADVPRLDSRGAEMTAPNRIAQEQQIGRGTP